MRLLIFEPHVFGHFVEYVRHIMLGWRHRGVKGELGVAISPRLVERHPDIVDLQYTVEDSRVVIYPVPTSEGIEYGTMSLLQAGFWHRDVLRTLVAKHRPDHLLCMYFDHAQLAFALQTRFPAATRFSGILLRPTLHYRQLPIGDRIRQLRKCAVLGLALRHPAIDAVFSLDPLAVDAINRLVPRGKARPIADPVDQAPPCRSAMEVRDELGVALDRRMALLFGTLTERKGAIETLRAFALLPREAARRLAVVIIGPVANHFRALLSEAVEAARDTDVQLVVRDTFVPDDQVSDLIHAADVLLMPYQRHVGSSGVLIRAAAAARPVVTQDYGLLGELVRRHELGLSVDTGSVPEIAEALGEASLGRIPFNSAAAAAFARQHTVDAFLDAVFSVLPENGADGGTAESADHHTPTRSTT